MTSIRADITSSSNPSTHVNPMQPQVSTETPHTVAAAPQTAAATAPFGNSRHTEDNRANNLTAHNAARANSSATISSPIGAPQSLTTTRQTRPSTSIFDVEAQAPTTRPQTMYGRFIVWRTEQKAALQTAGAIFAILFFSLELWGLIEGLVDEK